MDEYCDYKDCRVRILSADLCKRKPSECEWYKEWVRLKELEQHPLTLVLDSSGSLEKEIE